MNTRASVMAALLGVVFALLINFTVGQNQQHMVGGAMGWTIVNASFYRDWASRQTFRVGDILVFNFTTNFHDVARVSRDAYNRCSVNAIIGSPITTGPANITLSSTGNQYYICTFGTHCAQGGQRLSINVVSNSASRGASPPAASPPAAAPPPAATPPAAAPPTTTPGDSPSALPAAPSAQPPATPGQLGSGAGSLARSFLFVLASVGVYLVV